jgi:hypothetical protein
MFNFKSTPKVQNNDQPVANSPTPNNPNNQIPQPITDTLQTPMPPVLPNASNLADNSIPQEPANPFPQAIPDLPLQSQTPMPPEPTTPTPNPMLETSPNSTSEAEEIMAQISSLQEEFNTKYDELAEKIRVYLTNQVQNSSQETKLNTASTFNNLDQLTQDTPETSPQGILSSVENTNQEDNTPLQSQPVLDQVPDLSAQIPENLAQEELQARFQDTANQPDLSNPMPSTEQPISPSDNLASVNPALNQDQQPDSHNDFSYANSPFPTDTNNEQ